MTGDNFRPADQSIVKPLLTVFAQMGYELPPELGAKIISSGDSLALFVCGRCGNDFLGIKWRGSGNHAKYCKACVRY